ncbi:MAG TPA: hypothetical protein PLD36_05145 [Bacteroidia bacterium]|nr:hypothetical protein [Bacteroidia bacterium]
MNIARLNNWMLVAVIILLVSSCKKDDAPENPYDNIDYSNNSGNDTVLDPASIAGLHKNIFVKRCANPGCHDGTFEPDFRTVQSSWSTLVYQPVNIFTVDSINFFNYRVIPGDAEHSFLHDRITSATSDYMPSNSVRLTATEINYIKTWINNGAKDMYGNTPVKPDLPPIVNGYAAFDGNFYRIDTIRVGGIFTNPFIAPANSTFYLPFLATDTADGSSATNPAAYTVHKIKFSTNKNDFSNATLLNAVWNVPIPFDIWQGAVNTSQWPVGTIVYFRVYVNDGHQTSDMEFPRNSMPDYYKTYCSFKIQ